MQSTGKFEVMEGGASTQAPAGRMIMVLVAVCAVIAIIAVIIAAVAVSRPSSPNITIQRDKTSGGSTSSQTSGGSSGSLSGSGRATNYAGQRIYTIAIGHDYGAHEYIDTSGYLAGFSHDVIDAVCTEAGLDCRTVWDKYINCWDSTPGQPSHGGQGLMGGWYDACTGWYTTIDRVQVYQFSQPWLKPVMSSFFVKSASTFDPSAGVAGKKIGFLDGWASDEKCLYRWSTLQGREDINVVHFFNPEELVKALTEDKVDAVFAATTDMEPYMNNGIKQITSSTHSCMVAGNAMMTRKDNDFPSKWNAGFSKLVSSGKFKKLCDKANNDHSHRGQVNCVTA